MRMMFKFKMSVDDYRHMLMCRTFGSSWPKRLILLGSWLVFTVLIICDFTHVLQLSRVVHVCALMVAVALPAAIMTIEINVMKYKDAYKEGFKSERQIIADDDGLTFCNKSTNESGSNPWLDVTRLEEMKDVFVIQLNRQEAVILPKRGMGNNKKVDMFRELVQQKISERFYPLKKRYSNK